MAESCLGRGLGAQVKIAVSERQRLDEVLFGEVASNIIVSVDSEMVTSWEAYLQSNLAGSWQKIGMVGKPQTQLKILTNDNLSLINVKIDNVLKSWHRAIESRLSV